MLADKKKFELVEEALLRNGVIERFENQYGKIKGRMMISCVDIPEGIEVEEKGGETPVAFEASFDFFDAVVGFAIYTTEKKLATGMWISSQKEGADAPGEEWVEFFIKTLLSNIAEDGSFAYPIYSFVNDESDMTVVPTL